MNDGPLLISGKVDRKVVRTEVCRSFSYKLNCAEHGGAQYESRDFFCSQKAECSIEDAAEVSAALWQFCKAEVFRSVKEYINEMRRRNVA